MESERQDLPGEILGLGGGGGGEKRGNGQCRAWCIVGVRSFFFPGMKGMEKSSKDKNGRGLITHSVSITEHDQQPLDQALEVQW